MTTVVDGSAIHTNLRQTIRRHPELPTWGAVGFAWMTLIIAHGPDGLLPGEVVQTDPATGGVNFVRTAFQNAGRQNARGVDLSGQYQYQTQYGTFTALAQWAYMDQFVFQPTIDSKGRNTINQVSDPGTGGDGWYRWRGVSRLDWNWHNWDLNATWRYIGGYREVITVTPNFANLVH